MGLSIGSSSVKLVELKKSGKSWKLLHFGSAQLPEGAIVNREIANPIAVTEAIRSLVSQIKVGSKEVCTSLSGTSIIVRRMMLEVPNLKELQDQVFWEAEQYLPFDISEVVMDFHVLSRDKNNQTDILFVGVKKTVLDSYISCISDAGLVPKIVDLDFFAIQNIYELNYPTTNPNESAALVDIGAEAVKLVVVHNGIPVFTRDSTVGGRNLTADIQRNLNLSFTDAEALKIEAESGSNVPQEVSELVQVMNDTLASEIKKAIDYYHASSTGANITSVLLTGGSARLAGLSQMVEERVAIPTQILNTFNGISCDPAVFAAEYLHEVAPAAAIAAGLAIRKQAE